MRNIALIFAGGSGLRMGNGDLPKQFIEVDGKSILIWTLDFFETSEVIDHIILVGNPDWRDYLDNILEEYGAKKVASVVDGGVTSQDSIYQGLVEAQRLFDGENIVLLHDGVRPLITPQIIEDVVESVVNYGTGITCLPATETVVFAKTGVVVDGASIRSETYIASAPQGFILKEIFEAHNEMRRINPEYINIVDGCTLYQTLGKTVHLVRGPIGNIKLTRPEDVHIFEAIKNFRETRDI